jgi:predicted permease
MIRNYLKIAFRNLWRDKSYTIINVVGLSLGITCGILIFLLVSHHFSYDNYHKNVDRTYRVVSDLTFGEQEIKTPGVPIPVYDALKTDVPELEEVTEIRQTYNLVVTLEGANGQQQKFKQDEAAYVQPNWFDVFDYQWIEGSPAALEKPDHVVLTETLARKFFDEADPMGKTIRIDNERDYIVGGVLADLPENTDYAQEMLLPFAAYADIIGEEAMGQWGSVSSNHQVFAVLPANFTSQQLSTQLEAIITKNYPEEDQGVYTFKPQPLADIHFNPDYNGIAQRSYLWALALVGLFLILTACINFVNLATAQAINRAKEVGVRKVVGGSRAQLFRQFMLETGLLTLLAIIFSAVLAKMALPYLNQLTESDMRLDYFSDVKYLIFFVAMLILVTLFSGAYPAIVLTGFKPAEALKSKFASASFGSFSLRRALVVAQFVITQFLIIAAIVMTSQMEYFKNADMGFNKDAIVVAPLPVKEPSQMQTLKNQLLQVPGIESVSYSYSPPASTSTNTTNFRYGNRSEDEVFQINTKPGDASFLETYGLELVAGRNLQPSDTIREFLVNETLIEKLGLGSPEEAINQNLEVWGIEAPIVGVVKDFFTRTMGNEIDPVSIMSRAQSFDQINIKVSTANVPETLAAIDKTWNAQFPEHFYEYQFVDEYIAEFYQLESILLWLLRVFCGIAILIGCLGLYGLVSFMALRKTKEIGIRKVLGASFGNIVWIFGKEFTRLVLLAFLIAAPLAWWVMDLWLSDYAYRIDIGARIFIIAILATFAIVAFTVGYRTITAATENPVESLRSE